MVSFQESMLLYKQHMQQGILQTAYKGLMEYLMNLRTTFQKNNPSFDVSGNFYQGYMDMTYFSLTSPALKPLQLKIAIVFIHDTCSFEIWLAARNKRIQQTYWKLFQKKQWKNYSIPTTRKGEDAIIKYEIVPNPDFNNLDMLTKHIETETQVFIKDMETFLEGHKP